MDNDYYSNEIIDNFIKKTVCQNDETLYKYYESNDIKKFRRRLEILKVPHKTIETIIYTWVVDILRSVIHTVVGDLTIFLKPMGDLVVTGGEAFNIYMERKDRIITSDIDTKFVPIFNVNDHFFENLQVTKLLLWDKLGDVSKTIEPTVRKYIEHFKNSKLSKLFGISLPKEGPIIFRRYTLIKKSKQSSNNVLNVTPDDVLIDVELFALDLKLKYFSTIDNKINTRNIGGILDIAFMRPNEFGYEVACNKCTKGIIYRNKFLNKIVYNPNISYASENFLINDLYLMQTLGLRPSKKEKDLQRMTLFSKRVLGVNSITSKDTFYTIFNKVYNKLNKNNIPKRNTKNNLPLSLKKLALQVNPYKWQDRTEPQKLKTISLTGLKGPRFLNIEPLVRTSGPFRFNLNTKTWLRNNSVNYVKNEYNFRIPRSYIPSNNMPYGFNPKRNKETKILKLSAQIPLVGLKNRVIV